MSNINEKIKGYRIKNGFTQAEMAKKLGISQPAYHKIEVGKSDSLRVETLRNFCTTFEISADELLDLSPAQKPLNKKDVEVLRARGVVARPATTHRTLSRKKRKYAIK